VVGGVALACLIGGWVHWYNSLDQRLKRCETAEEKRWYANPQSQYLHARGADPPMALFIEECDDLLGVKPGESSDNTSCFWDGHDWRSSYSATYGALCPWRP
jgi:hypothetical protein